MKTDEKIVKENKKISNKLFDNKQLTQVPVWKGIIIHVVIIIISIAFSLKKFSISVVQLKWQKQ